MSVSRRSSALAALLGAILVAVLPASAASADPDPSPAAVVRDLASDVPATAAPALVAAGTTADGWPAYRLADGRLPDAVPEGGTLRGEVRFQLQGRERAVRLLVPPNAQPGAPLLIALHGLYQTMSGIDAIQGWGALARREGVVLAYGVGSYASWNAGTCCGRAVQEAVDDVAYLDRVVAIAGALRAVNPRRLHLAGFSNGAMMAYRYACERRTRVASLLAVAGTVTAACQGRSDVGVLHVHGSADTLVPLAGTAWSRRLRTSLRPVSATARMFGPTVQAKLLPGFGHAWPTVARGRYDTTRSGWAFLAAHPRRS